MDSPFVFYFLRSAIKCFIHVQSSANYIWFVSVHLYCILIANQYEFFFFPGVLNVLRFDEQCLEMCLLIAKGNLLDSILEMAIVPLIVIQIKIRPIKSD